MRVSTEPFAVFLKPLRNRQSLYKSLKVQYFQHRGLSSEILKQTKREKAPLRNKLSAITKRLLKLNA